MFDFSAQSDFLLLILSVVLSYLCGRLQARNTQRVDAARERYTNFYVPFIANLYGGLIGFQNFSSLSPNARGIFFDLIMKNVHYLGHDSLSQVTDFYLAFLNVYEYENDPSSNPDVPAQADKVFNTLTVFILREAQTLSADLHMPDIAGPLLKDFFSKR